MSRQSDDATKSSRQLHRQIQKKTKIIGAPFPSPAFSFLFCLFYFFSPLLSNLSEFVCQSA